MQLVHRNRHPRQKKKASKSEKTTTTFELPFEEDAYVRFTHFARFDKGNEINTRTILAAFVRGMAVQCDKNHALVDIVILIVMKASGIPPGVGHVGNLYPSKKPS